MQPRGRGAWDGAQDGAQLCHSHETSFLSASVSPLVEVRDKILKLLRFLLRQTSFHLAPSKELWGPRKKQENHHFGGLSAQKPGEGS